MTIQPLIQSLETGIFESKLPYDARRIHAAAIYCSDGRFGKQCDDFLDTALQLPRYDRLLIPGGSACLAGHFDVFRQADVIMDHIAFLTRVHGLEKMVLIAHENCAFYSQQLGISEQRVNAQQREDLDAAAGRIRKAHSSLVVEGYFAARRENRISFEPVPLREDHPGW